MGPSFHVLIYSHYYALCKVSVESTLCVIAPPLTGDWNHTDGKRLEAGSCVGSHFQQSGLGTEHWLYVQGPVIPSREKRERRGETTKRLSARAVDRIVCCVAPCGGFVVGAL